MHSVYTQLSETQWCAHAEFADDVGVTDDSPECDVLCEWEWGILE